MRLTFTAKCAPNMYAVQRTIVYPPYDDSNVEEITIGLISSEDPIQFYPNYSECSKLSDLPLDEQDQINLFIQRIKPHEALEFID